MTTFMREPLIVLTTQDDAAQALRHPGTWDTDATGYRTKSVWLCELIRKMQTETGEEVVSNDAVCKRAASALGLTHFYIGGEYATWTGSPLSKLVYNAQMYARSDKLRAEGYEPFTPEAVERAHRDGMVMEIAGRKCWPLFSNGKWYARPSRARTHVYAPDYDSPVKVYRDSVRLHKVAE